MNVRTDRQIDRQIDSQTDRQTDRIHILHIYVGLTQARPNYPRELSYSGAYTTLSIQVMGHQIETLSSQNPRNNAVSSFIVNTCI